MLSARQLRADARDAVRQNAFQQTVARAKAESEYNAYVQQHFVALTAQPDAFAYVPIPTLVTHASLVSTTWRAASMHRDLYRTYTFILDEFIEQHRQRDDAAEMAFRAWLPSMCVLMVRHHMHVRNPFYVAFESLLSNPATAASMHHAVEFDLRHTWSPMRVRNNMCCLRKIRNLSLGTIENLHLACGAEHLHTVSARITESNEHDVVLCPGRDIITNQPIDCHRLRYVRAKGDDNRADRIVRLNLDHIGAMTKLRALTIMEYRCRLANNHVVESASRLTSTLAALLHTQRVLNAAPQSVLCLHAPTQSSSSTTPPSLSTISLRITREMFQTPATMERFAHDTQVMLTEVDFASPHVHTLDLSGWCVALNEPVESPLCDDAYREYVLRWLVRCFPRLECLYMCEFHPHTHAWARQLLAAHPTLRVVVMDGGATEQGAPLAAMVVPPSASLSCVFMRNASDVDALTDAVRDARISAFSVAIAHVSGNVNDLEADAFDVAASAAVSAAAAVIVANAIPPSAVYRSIHGDASTSRIPLEPAEDDLLLTILEHLQFVSHAQHTSSRNMMLAYALVWRDGDKDSTRQPW